MNKRIRQYIGLISAIAAYYIVHEGAHLIYALITGAFKRINIMGLGVQIDIYSDKINDFQLGAFCLVGSLATLALAYALVSLADVICRIRSKVARAIGYYVTIAMLLIDPLYLSVLCGFFGGGDMNGIQLLLNGVIVRIGYGALLILNVILFVKIVLPKYKASFADDRR